LWKDLQKKYGTAVKRWGVSGTANEATCINFIGNPKELDVLYLRLAIMRNRMETMEKQLVEPNDYIDPENSLAKYARIRNELEVKIQDRRNINLVVLLICMFSNFCFELSAFVNSLLKALQNNPGLSFHL
jgi:hypothetical protein